MLERIPLTEIAASVGGETQLRGTVFSAARTLQAPKTNTESVYYVYEIEEEYKDSDGDTKWRTIHKSSNVVDFYIGDSTGRALVEAREGFDEIDWSVPRKYYRTEGCLLYTSPSPRDS